MGHRHVVDSVTTRSTVKHLTPAASGDKVQGPFLLQEQIPARAQGESLGALRKAMYNYD